MLKLGRYNMQEFLTDLLHKVFLTLEIAVFACPILFISAMHLPSDATHVPKYLNFCTHSKINTIDLVHLVSTFFIDTTVSSGLIHAEAVFFHFK